jgi:hypothetical protein
MYPLVVVYMHANFPAYYTYRQAQPAHIYHSPWRKLQVNGNSGGRNGIAVGEWYGGDV